ncbi:FAD-binding oxidoreductase [Streptomyces actinomycinicus]|uniref:FAD-binding oxidoreductase n=1 Tax=Streptomyces actinomycinicus TaxID=1695166 RepID=A0A937ER57_9ACTN|nr:FAD-binding oxidoreductase [Streptomyces actinomycinicus]MBL1087621.1 FAD-binding oxidoreductase [Streptomyces actinomycinicus]
MFSPRDVYGVVRPRSAEEVRTVVRAFARAEGGPRLQALSTGRNWGLGSREPARDAVVTLELQALDAVRDLDVEGGWAIVEPGVTQLRLAELLADTDRMLNVTASSGHTSVLGNIADRGVGLRRQRTLDLAGLEVVLPDGELIRVGWWPQGERPGAVNPQGLGPSPLALFTQSDLGIITAGVVRLLPRPEAQCVLRLGFGRDRLTEAVDELRRWTAQGLVSGVLKVYDTVSTRSYGGHGDEYLAHLCVDGTERSVAAVTRVVEEEAARSGLFTRVLRSDEQPPAPDDLVARALERLYAGDPSRNETMLRSAVGEEAELVDAKGGGWLFFLPLIPFTGRAVARSQELLARVHAETGVLAGSTVNALDPDVIDLVVSFRFARTEAGAARAHRALDRTYELFAEAGFHPYRLDSDHHQWVDRLSADPGARDLVRRLKQTIDPRQVIAPGRYA